MAAAGGLFAEYGLDVEIIESPPGAQRVKLVAGGKADFGLTALTYFLQALADDPDLPARFVSVVHQRNSIAAIVLADADMAVPADLVGRRLGGPPGEVGLGWLVREHQAALNRLGLDESKLIAMNYGDALAALGRGDVDAVATLHELLPLVARRTTRALRAISFGIGTYASGLVAGDSVAADVVTRMQLAVGAALERQRAEPERGLDELVRRYPEVNPEDAVDSWSLLEPYVFTGDAPGAMTAVGWQRTLAYASSVHRLPLPPLRAVWRGEAHRPPATRRRPGSTKTGGGIGRLDPAAM